MIPDRCGGAGGGGTVREHGAELPRLRCGGGGGGGTLRGADTLLPP